MGKGDGALLNQMTNEGYLKLLYQYCHEVGARGRTWGSRVSSSIPGSNITLTDGKVTCYIYQENGNGNLELLVHGDKRRKLVKMVEKVIKWFKKDHGLD